MLSVGDKAPAFKLESDDGKTRSLKDFSGKTLVVYFYPRDNTPGCTVEAQDFSRLIDKFHAEGVSVVGISRDSIASHCNFRDKHKLKFPLLSDPDLSVHKAFGAWGEKMNYGKKTEGTLRSTFVIDGKGVVVSVFANVKVAGHAEKVLDSIAPVPTTAKSDHKSEEEEPVKKSKTETAAPKAKPTKKATGSKPKAKSKVKAKKK